MLNSLNTRDISLVHQLQTELGFGDTVTRTRWLDLEEHQRHLAQVLGVANEPPSARELFKLIRDQDVNSLLVGPRWWFHLIGLRHGSVHIILLTPQQWVVVQRRSWSKDDSPGALDIAVAGHIGLADPEEAAWREMAEEVGLTKAHDGEMPSLVDNALTFVTCYDTAILRKSSCNPPFVDVERRWIYTAKLTAEGMARMHFMDGEVTSLMLLGSQDLQKMNERCREKKYTAAHEIDLASGLIETLPRWLEAMSN